MNGPTFYMKVFENSNVIVLFLYVDKLFVVGINSRLINDFKKKMTKILEIIDLGIMSYFLGIKVHQLENGIFIS